MGGERRRGLRIIQLTNYYIIHDYDEKKLLKRIKAIGVSNATAKDYLSTVKARVGR